MKHAVIIGGGLGGLATALRLGARGWRVTVCEQGPRFGGKMNVWERDGFRFDTGPSLLTMPWVFRELFEAAGGCLDEHAELVRVHPLAEQIFADGTRFTYSTSLPDWLATLDRLDPRDREGFLRFLHLGARLYALSRETFLRRTPASAPDLRALRALRHFPLRHAWGNYHRTVERHFRSPYLRQMFDRYPTYVGSSPYRSPATLAVIPFIEYAFGGWHVRGGLYRIVEGMTALARGLGVELLTGARVERIERDGQGRVRGVRLAGGERLKADVVVLNGDAATTDALLGASGGSPREPRRDARANLNDARARMKKEEPSSGRSLSGFVMLLGVGRELRGLAHHGVYFSPDYRREFNELFDERRFPDEPTVYVCAPSRTDRTLAPDGGETLFVMANAPASDGGWTEEETGRARARIFERLSKSGFPSVEADVVVSDVWTPARIAREYLMPGGAIYGTDSHGWRRAFLRPSNKVAGAGGLYRVGGSTHPGGGTPTVLLSAEITCELIRRHER